MEQLGKLIDDFHCWVALFDVDYNRIYHLDFNNILELLPEIIGLHTLYQNIDNKFNKISKMAKSINVDWDGEYGDYLEEVTDEYMRVTAISDKLNKIIMVV